MAATASFPDGRVTTYIDELPAVETWARTQEAAGANVGIVELAGTRGDVDELAALMKLGAAEKSARRARAKRQRESRRRNR